MKAPLRKDPLRDLLVIQDQINRVFEDRLNSLPSERVGATPLPATGAFQPPIDVYESEGALIVDAELPGLSAEDVQVKVEGGILTIRGERKRPAGPRVKPKGGRPGSDRYHRMERRFGTFVRAFTLPPSVDSFSLETSFEEGVLRVILSKKSSKASSIKKNRK